MWLDVGLWSSLLACIALSNGFVGLLYVWRSWFKNDRNDPRVIFRRMISVLGGCLLVPITMCYFSVDVHPYLLHNQDNLSITVTHMVGHISSSVHQFPDHTRALAEVLSALPHDTPLAHVPLDSLPAGPSLAEWLCVRVWPLWGVLFALSLTALAFSGHLVAETLDTLATQPTFDVGASLCAVPHDVWSGLTCDLVPAWRVFLDSLSPTHSPLSPVTHSTALSHIRNLVVAPLVEELVYRACVDALLSAGGWSVFWRVVWNPVLFALSHAHHLWDLTQARGLDVKSAVVTVGVQLAYTSLFAVYAVYLLVRTRHTLAVVAAHTLCNYWGLPSLGSEQTHSHRHFIYAAHALGLTAFAAVLAYY